MPIQTSADAPEPSPGLVLVVDDNAATAALVAGHLARHGIATCTAGDGAGALAAARSRRPDVVLLDSNLPDIAGTEVCRLIKSDPGLAGTLVAFLSAERTSVPDRIQGLNTGADAYLTHPVDGAELAASVASLLRLRHAELATRDSRDLYRELLDAAPIGIAHIAPDGTVVTVNRALAAMLAAEPGQIAGRLFDVFLHPDERPTMRTVLAEVIAGDREPRTRELRLLTSGGATAWAVLAGRLHRRPDGSPGHFVVTLEDITARRAAETALRGRELLLHELYEASHDLVATVDADGRIEQANSAFRRALGAAPGALREVSLEALLAPAFRTAWRDALARVVRGAGDELFRGTLIGREQVPIHVEGSLARRDAADTPAVRLILHDVSGQRRLEEQLRLNQRLDSIGTLAGGIAHDLNNVLAPIFLSLDLLRTAGESDRVDYIDAIERCARRASDLVRQVILFARGADVEKSTFEPDSLLRELRRTLEPTFPGDIVIEWTGPGPDTPRIHGNPTQLNQVLLNLCLNARDAMPGGGRLHIECRAAAISEAEAAAHPGAIAGPAVAFIVQDTGHGIPSAIRERIFDPFFTTKGVGAGSGLGLPTALGIVRSHGGILTAGPAPGTGSSFEMRLPAATPARSPAPESPGPALLPRKGELVLVIEDERLLREAVDKVLRDQGFTVISAADGAEGVARASGCAAELRLVLTDIIMPRLDGYATAAAIRRFAPDVPIVGMTGQGGSGPDARARAAGITRLLAKPFEPADLLRAVEAALDGASTPDPNPVPALSRA